MAGGSLVYTNGMDENQASEEEGEGRRWKREICFTALFRVEWSRGGCGQKRMRHGCVIFENFTALIESKGENDKILPDKCEHKNKIDSYCKTKGEID